MRPRPGRLVVAGAFVAVLIALPVIVTIVQALQGGLAPAVDALKDSAPRALLANSLLVTVVAAPVCAVLGVGTAWLVERTTLPGRRIWTLLLVAPLTMPLFVTSYAWATLGGALQGFLGAAGIIAFSYYPVVFLLAIVALRGMDPALEDTARSLGLSAWRTFWRVVLPQLRPAILGGVLLVALDTLVEFDAFVALKFQTFTIHIYAQYQLSFSSSGAAALSMISLVLCVVLLLGELGLRGGANYTRVSHGARRALTRYRLGRATPAALAAVGLVVAIGLGHSGRRARVLVHAEQPPRVRLRHRQPPLPVARDADLGRPRGRFRDPGARIRGSDRDPRGAQPRAGRDGDRAQHVSVVRATRSGRRDCARVRGEPLRAISFTAA